MIDAWLDLVLGSRCSACGAPGRALCRGCAAGLPRHAVPAWPTPTPPGLLPPWSTGEYADPLRSLVVDHKDHGRLALARPLGRLLAVAVTAATGAQEAGEVHLVPVPSHPAVVRRRGQDPLLRMTHCAAAALRRRGVAASVRPLLRVVARPGDQAGLGAGERAANVAGRFAARARAADGYRGRQDRPGAAPLVLLVDDVITTGATLREAQRALEDAGVAPVAAATVAATRRRHAEGRDAEAPRVPVRPAGG